MLGVMQGMDRNNVDKIEHLLKEAVVLADLMRTGFLSKNDAWFALYAVNDVCLALCVMNKASSVLCAVNEAGLHTIVDDSPPP